MAKPGPAPKEIDLRRLKRLAKANCSFQEVAWYFGCNVKTIERRLKQEQYRRTWDLGQAERRLELREGQKRLAKVNALMSIFLGKQELGQRDVLYEEITYHDSEQARQLLADRIARIAARLNEAGITGFLDAAGNLRTALQLDVVGEAGAEAAAGELASLVDPDRARLGENADGSGNGTTMGPTGG